MYKGIKNLTHDEQIRYLCDQVERLKNEIEMGRVWDNKVVLDINTGLIKPLIIAGQIATKDLIRADEITTEQMKSLVDVYPPYELNKSYKIGDIFKHDGNMFEVVQAHTSQADWVPSTTTSLYKNKTPSVVIPNWVQPIGSTDAYKMGDKVIFDDKTYESVINDNVWSPTGYPAGWKLI